MIVTEEMRQVREALHRAGSLGVPELPAEMAEFFAQSFAASLETADMDTEQMGWALLAASGLLVMLTRCIADIQAIGPDLTAEENRLAASAARAGLESALGLLARAGDRLLTQAELPPLD